MEKGGRGARRGVSQVRSGAGDASGRGAGRAGRHWTDRPLRRIGKQSC